ncbi:unnamed protein product [Linum trigynum]|uniref:Uncharacterized protein n=1 Tax=Linum trigynum TaxID=586398 RepID=A0AAV2EME4_9ROSI
MHVLAQSFISNPNLQTSPKLFYSIDGTIYSTSIGGAFYSTVVILLLDGLIRPPTPAQARDATVVNKEELGLGMWQRGVMSRSSG